MLRIADSTKALASHADVLRVSSRVPAPRTSAAYLSGKKRRPITADFQIDLGSALWTLRSFARSLCVCVWLVNTLTTTAPIGSPIICK